MIRIPEFADKYLTSEMKRGKVKRPHWFKCPVDDSPELQMILLDHPKGVKCGFAVLGVWEQIQKWAVRNWKRSGQFILKDGTPMPIKQIAVAIGLNGHTDFLTESINVLVAVGWLEEIEGAPKVEVPDLSEVRRNEGTVIKEVKVMEPDTGEYTRTVKQVKVDKAKEAIEYLRDQKNCPRAYENPRELEDALCEAVAEGRDVMRVAKAMSLYYQSEQGTSKYRTRPDKFVRNRKDEEDWNTWFNAVETQKLRAHYIKSVAVRSNNEDMYVEMMKRNKNTPLTEIIDRVEKWEQEQESKEQ